MSRRNSVALPRPSTRTATTRPAPESRSSDLRAPPGRGDAFALSDTATLRPSLELGLRHDGGDAETGAGVELGGGVGWADTATGLSLADSDYEEWGASATLRLDPGARGRGPSLLLAPTIGASSSATERLWGAHDARGIAPGGVFEAARGLQAEAGYGLGVFGGRFTGTPNLGLGFADGGTWDWRLGWRLTSPVPGDPVLEVNLERSRRGSEESARRRGRTRNGGRRGTPRGRCPTFDSLGAIDALEASGFARAQAAALSQQLLIAVNTPSPKIEEELDELIAVVGKTIRQARVITAGFTLLNLAILASILLTLSS